ncbi:MAG: diguanylate cyclase domain-containing protein [Acidobacteriota bacterium]
MQHLDGYTLLVLNLFICLASAFGIATVWIQNRSRYGGMFLWLCSIAMHAIGLALIILRPVLPSLFSVVLTNVVMVSGAILLLIGLERFVGLKGPRAHHPVLLAACAGFTSYFTFIHPNMGAMLVSMSLIMTVIASQTTWLLLFGVDSDMRRATQAAGAVMCGYVLLSLVRVALYFFVLPESHDIFRTGLVDEAATVLHTVLNVGLTISLALMVNRRLIQDVQAQEEKFSRAFHSAPYGVMLMSVEGGEIIEVNDSFARMTGYASSELSGRKTLDLHLFQNDEDGARMVEALRRGSTIKGMEVRFRTKSGEPMTGLFHAERVRIRNKECILVSLGDITELSQMKSKLEILATHDVLTGLPNRTLFRDRFGQALAQARRHGSMMAIVSLDLDKFKRINDDFGHQAGDAVLVEVARRLTGVLRKSDTVSRFGGDEFVLLLGEVPARYHALQAAAKIVHALQEPFHWEESVLSLCASVGICLFPDDGSDIEELLRKSDDALYGVKGQGGNGFRFYSEPEDISLAHLG